MRFYGNDPQEIIDKVRLHYSHNPDLYDKIRMCLSGHHEDVSYVGVIVPSEMFAHIVTYYRDGGVYRRVQRTILFT